MNFYEAPSWLQAADQHTIASSGTSLFEDVAGMLGRAPDFAAVAAASALTSFYNSGVVLSNLAQPEGAELKEADTAEVIASYDDDLAKYYQENKEAADLVGFIGGSFIPGTAGVKGLRAAQGAIRAAEAGVVGSNMRFATNLLAPAMETYVKREAADLAARSATFSFMHQNSLKALAAGTHQAVLESLAFEVAVTATMFRSPMLSDMDTSDIIKNMGMGVVFGGALGTVGSAASSYFGVKRLLRSADERQVNLATGSTQLTKSGSSTAAADRMYANLDDQLRLSAEVTPEQVLAMKRAAGETGESITDAAVRAETAHINRLRQDNLQKLKNEMRKDLRSVAKEDDLGNLAADFVEKISMEGRQSLLFNLKQIGRIGTKTDLETRARQMVRDKEAKTFKEALSKIDDEAASFVQLHSGKVGEVTAGKAGYMRLADKLTKGEIKEVVGRFAVSYSKAADYRKLKNLEEIEARWIAARESKVVWNDKVVLGSHDLPFLQRAVDDGVQEVSVRMDDGKVIRLKSQQEIQDWLYQAKDEVINAQRAAKRGDDYLEMVSDVRREYLATGKSVREAGEAAHAQASYAKEASQFYGREISALDLHMMPRKMKVIHNTEDLRDADGMLLEGMQLIKYREKLAKEATDRAVTAVLGEIALIFPEISEDLLRRANRTGSGAGKFTNAGAAYGTLEEMTSYIGNLTAEATKARIGKLQETLNPVAVRLVHNPEAAVAFSGVNEILSGTPERYVFNEAGDALIPRKMRDYYQKLAEGEEVSPPTLYPGSPEEIPLVVGLRKGAEDTLDEATEALREAVALHIQQNGARNKNFRTLNAAQGLEDHKFDDVFYPFRPNPRDYKFVAFVKDETLTGVGHTKMLFANTAKELEEQIAKVPSPLKVYRKGQAEEYYDARGQWMYDKSLHDNYLDHELATRGIMSRYLPMTDPKKIVDTWMADHIAKENTLIKEAIALKYQKEITELKRLGELFTNSHKSHVGKLSITEEITEAQANPYLSQVKSMLNIVKLDEAPAGWVTANQALDRMVSKAYDTVQQLFGRGSYKITDDQIDAINETFEGLGLRSAYYDAATHLLANSNVPRGVLSKFVRESNAFLTSTILRLDAMNSLNNLVGNTVLFSAELKAVTKAIMQGSEEGAGELAKLMKIGVPGDQQALISSPSKLIANSMQRILGEGKEALIAEYKKRGLAPDLTDQFFKALDSMALTGTESVKDLSRKSAQLKEAWSKFVEKGSKLTGNTWSEQFNRLIAADVMKQITEVAVKHGVLDEKAAWAYVNTFTNRVNGVIRAAERPLIFQGPIGQAIGLFQSYQFNLMQQMFRYVGDGNRKIAAMAMGLQGSIYGASSLPGFSAINNYLIGSAYGNPEHKDMYTIANTVLGKTGAEWLMYGAPSNILRASLYTRGDTNPRTWSVVPNPTNPMEVPFVAAYSKAIGSMAGILKNVSGGAPVYESFLHGLEHAGLSRPLAGMAAVARSLSDAEGKVKATSATGDITGSNDLVSWASLVRVAGAKPIDEAMLTNHFFRVNAYAQKDREKRKEIATQIKLGALTGRDFTAEQVEQFAERYVQYGGKQTGFNQFWMQQFKNTDATRAEQLMQNLGTPYARTLQQLMGGRDSLDELD